MTTMVGQNHGVESSGPCRGDFVSGSSLFDYLPEDCISKIISFTSQRDACVVASVSKTFESAAKSDIVWEKFLPTEYESLVPRSPDLSSKKELYFALCDDPVLIDDGTKSFWLEKESGKKCIMLSAMNISIIWGDTPRYWKWITNPEARFKKVARLLKVCWFEIRGRINTSVLSPRTRYTALIVFKIDDRFHGFDDVAIEAGVGLVGHEAPTRSICFDADMDMDEAETGWIYPEEREDGWMEIELGEFFNGGGLMDSDEVEMSASETRELGWKGGLIIQGFEIRPSKIQ